MTARPLHAVTRGSAGSRVLFCHGLFGQGRNWTEVAKALSAEHRAVLADMPHHGRSPWDQPLDYVTMADQVAGLLSPDDPATVVGHSMGGKIAMVLALRHPRLVSRLCVVDMAPVSYGPDGQFGRYVEAMRGLDLGRLEHRQDADAALAGAVPDPTVRGFLLQNLRRQEGTWSWQVNLSLLGDRLDVLADWPEETLAGTEAYRGRVLWVAGEHSPYVHDGQQPSMLRWFPRTRSVTVKGAGHWVHADRPAVFVSLLRHFLAED